MRRLFLRTAALLCLGGAMVLPAWAEAKPPKVLMVVSSHGADGGKAQPGFDMREFAMAWAVLRDNGFAVDVASPRGGAVEADPHKPDMPAVRRALADAQVARQLRETLTTAAVDPSEYAAVFVIGGKGPMFDLHGDAGVQNIARAVHLRRGVVAAVCHGPAALLNVTLPDGQPLLRGRRVTAITESEDRRFSKKWVDRFPFQLEQALKERGARFEAAPALIPHVVVDDRLITGQNPWAAPLVAEAVVRALGRQPVAREPDIEERTLALVKQHLAGDVAGVRAQLQREPGRYKADLIGYYGHLMLEDGRDPAHLRAALAMMQTAALHVTHPQLQAWIERAQQMLEQSASR